MLDRLLLLPMVPALQDLLNRRQGVKNQAFARAVRIYCKTADVILYQL